MPVLLGYMGEPDGPISPRFRMHLGVKGDVVDSQGEKTGRYSVTSISSMFLGRNSGVMYGLRVVTDGGKTYRYTRSDGVSHPITVRVPYDKR